LHGFARICIGREVVEAGEELIGGVGHANADEVGTGLAEGAGRELVAREGLDFMGEGDRVFAFRVLGEFTVDEVVKRDIDGDVVAVVEIESEMEKLRGGRGKLEAEPVFGGGLFSGITERDIRSFVAGGDHWLTEAEGSSVPPEVIGLGFELGAGGKREEGSADGDVGGVGNVEGEPGTRTDVGEKIPIASVKLLREHDFVLATEFNSNAALAERGGGRNRDEQT